MRKADIAAGPLASHGVKYLRGKPHDTDAESGEEPILSHGVAKGTQSRSVEQDPTGAHMRKRHLSPHSHGAPL